MVLLSVLSSLLSQLAQFTLTSLTLVHTDTMAALLNQAECPTDEERAKVCAGACVCTMYCMCGATIVYYYVGIYMCGATIVYYYVCIYMCVYYVCGVATIVYIAHHTGS